MKHLGHTLSQDLLDLGAEIVDKMDKDAVEPIFTDCDFQDRSVLHLITLHGFDKLMEDAKITVLLEKLWQGDKT